MSVKPELSRKIKNEAAGLGFDLCGIARLRPLDEHRQKIGKWLEQGYHAGMTYMARHYEKRIDPSQLVPGASSLIIVAMNYYRDYNPPDDKPVFSRYALGQDYHKVLKEGLYKLLGFIREKIPGTEGRVFVDTAPVLERVWAVEAGLGWIGRNSMLINRDKGSYIFLGVLVINAPLEYDRPAPKDYCGSCRKCIDACPTGAIMENRMIDANKCLSYQTIENKGEIPQKYVEKAGRKIFGCDICQEVCPWNKKASETRIKEFEPLPEIIHYTTEQWRRITEEEFNTIFSNSAVLRTGYDRFMNMLL